MIYSRHVPISKSLKMSSFDRRQTSKASQNTRDSAKPKCLLTPKRCYVILTLPGAEDVKCEEKPSGNHRGQTTPTCQAAVFTRRCAVREQDRSTKEKGNQRVDLFKVRGIPWRCVISRDNQSNCMENRIAWKRGRVSILIIFLQQEKSE